MPEAIIPLKLPPNFNPETHMLARREGDRTYHAPRLAAELAADLLANGAPQDIAQAEQTLDAMLRCQETRAGDPHRGNFLWEAEDDAVEDLNAVQFCLFQLIPMMIRHGDRLSASTQNRVRDAIRLGLEEIARIDVHPRYTNIVLKDITNTCLGGEYLEDDGFARRGYDKFQRWMQYTDRSGCAYEFNSPTYAGVALRVLKRLTELIKHEPTRIGAEIMRARLGLSAVLHIHPATGRWAGPFSRAYRPTVFCETAPEIQTVRDWIAADIVPGWLSDALTQRPDTMPLTETADAENGVGLSTYHGPHFSLGVSTQELTSQANRFIAGQSNCFIVHHSTGTPQPGVIYSRYVLNDHWLGSFRSTPARSNLGLLFEEGQFLGVQDGPCAICLYNPRTLGAWEPCHSAKAVIAWHHRDHVSGVWIDGRPITAFPAAIPENATVVVASGPILIAVRPLTRTDLGRNAPAHVVERDGHLCLEIHNYKGPAKTFWEQAHPGSFYQGRLQCGFYAEVAEQTDWPDPVAFSSAVASGTLRDKADPPATYDQNAERRWTVEYARDKQTLGIEIDLMAWALKRRWTHAGELGWPMLESPLARQSRSGHIEVADAQLTCGADPAWLFACPGARTYAAVYHGPERAPLALTVPDGSVKLHGLRAGLVIWRDGKVIVDALDLQDDPEISGGERI